VRVFRVIAVLVVLALAASCQSRADAALRAGNAAANAGQLEAARAHFADAVAANPADAKGYSLLGSTLATQGKLEEAVTAWRAALEREPADPIARMGLARADLATGDAGACLGRLEGLAPIEEATLLRAQALLRRGNEGDAATVERELQASTRADAVYLRASALLELRRFGDAQQAYSSLEKQAPALASYGLARLAAAQGRATDVLLHLAAAKSAAGATWNPTVIAADPAFGFLADADDFRTLTRP
jgi:Flp pilus assembly protein TadD